MKWLLHMLLHLFVFILSISSQPDRKPSSREADSIVWICPELDRALITFELEANPNVQAGKVLVNYQYEICNECDMIPFKIIEYDPQLDQQTPSNSTLDSYYSYYFEVMWMPDFPGDSQLICDRFVYRKFGECGVYKFRVNLSSENEDHGVKRCSIDQIRSAQNPDIYMILAVGVILGFFVLCVFVEIYHMRIWAFVKRIYRNTFTTSVKPTQSTEQGDTQPLETLTKNPESTEENKNPIEEKQAPKKKRLQALDTFRGLSLFLMIFVNYGSGGYKYLQHVPWHGITIADFVFPWFLWIMGFSIPLATHSLISKPNACRWSIFLRITIRSIKMFLIGIILNSRFGVKLEDLRIFGVLQRIAICYFIVASLELILYTKVNLDITKKNLRYYLYDLIWSWAHLLVISLVVFVWFMLSYFVQIEGCPKGYMGPGGLEHHGAYFNCTGGVAGYFDRLILGRKHVYQWPTTREVYKTTEPFDPEGFFGIFNSVLLTYMGVQGGRIINMYRSRTTHQLVKLFLWGLVSLALFFGLTQLDMEHSWVPVNKNLWTFTFTLVTGASSFFLFILLYIVIDIKSWWSGCPLIYLGMNSIVIYFCHAVFANALPISFIVPYKHLDKLLMTLWGCICWNLIAIYLYLKKIFINL